MSAVITLTTDFGINDRFGNAAIHIPRNMIQRQCSHFFTMTVTLGKTVLRGLATHCSTVSAGKTGALINSWPVLEIIRREGHASR